MELTEVEDTAEILTSILGFEQVEEEENAIRFRTGSELGHSLIIEKVPFRRGQNGAGIIHHVAFQTKDEEDLKKLRHEVVRLGLRPTEIIDRHFFKSVYFHTPGGVLFEMATHGPGYFVNSDPKEDQAEKLELTPWHESRRQEIEAALPTIKT